MKKFGKRLAAYFIDIAIVSIVVLLLTSNDKVNFQYKNYQKYYEDYHNTYQKYTNTINKEAKLDSKYKDKKIVKKKYDLKKKAYNKDIKKYESKVKKLQYKVMRNSVIYYVIYIALILAYFGIFQYSFNGQTLGKKLMKIKVVGVQDRDINIWKLLIRSFIVYNLWIYIVSLILSYSLSYMNYYSVYSVLNGIGSSLQIIIIMMIVMNKDSRGLHDYLAGTIVVDDIKGDE